MKYKQYSDEMWAQLKSGIQQATARESTPVAAFDADGTLWDTDLGEGFFHYLIDRKLVPLPEDPWNYYVEMKKVDRSAAYLWLAQILKGQTLAQVRAWADEAVTAQSPLPFFSEQKKLIDLLKAEGVKVLIVTASVKWAVEPGARLLGLENEAVIGIETEVIDGLVTDQLKGVVTHQEGKATALLKRTGGTRPFLTSGNTMGDLELLETSTDLKLVVSAAAADERLFRTEKELLALGRTRSWLTHRFIES